MIKAGYMLALTELYDLYDNLVEYIDIFLSLCHDDLLIKINIFAFSKLISNSYGKGRTRK